MPSQVEVLVAQSHNPSLDVIRFFSDIFRLAVAIGIVYVASRPLDPPADLTSGVPWGFLGFLVIGLGMALFRYRRPHARAAEALHQAAQEFKTRQSAGEEARAAAHEPSQQVGEADTAPRTADQDSPPEAFKDHQPLLGGCAAENRSGYL